MEQKVSLELDKYWSNQWNNKAVLKVQVVEFQEKYPWTWTTPWNSSGWLISVLHPLEQSMPTLKQSKHKNCMFIHTSKMLLKGNVPVMNVDSHSKEKQMGFQFNLATVPLKPCFNFRSALTWSGKRCLLHIPSNRTILLCSGQVLLNHQPEPSGRDEDPPGQPQEHLPSSEPRRECPQCLWGHCTECPRCPWGHCCTEGTQSFVTL